VGRRERDCGISRRDIEDTDDEEESVLALLKAAERGDEAKLRKLIDMGVDVDAAAPSWQAADRWQAAFHSVALMSACVYDNLDCARVLLEAGADINRVAEHGETALTMSCQLGRTEETALMLIAARADIHHANTTGMRRTALIYASQHGKEKVVRHLLNAGAAPRDADMFGGTAASLASMFGFPVCVRLLLQPREQASWSPSLHAGFLPAERELAVKMMRAFHMICNASRLPKGRSAELHHLWKDLVIPMAVGLHWVPMSCRDMPSASSC
jgi:hypothetical protein